MNSFQIFLLLRNRSIALKTQTLEPIQTLVRQQLVDNIEWFVDEFRIRLVRGHDRGRLHHRQTVGQRRRHIDGQVAENLRPLVVRMVERRIVGATHVVQVVRDHERLQSGAARLAFHLLGGAESGARQRVGVQFGSVALVHRFLDQQIDALHCGPFARQLVDEGEQQTEIGRWGWKSHGEGLFYFTCENLRAKGTARAIARCESCKVQTVSDVVRQFWCIFYTTRNDTLFLPGLYGQMHSLEDRCTDPFCGRVLFDTDPARTDHFSYL